MSTIARATIKSYDATTHSATVQIAGSLAVWLDAVPVSDGIAPADVVAGRECGVIFFTDDNPTDAAIVTVHNAVPVGWPGTAVPHKIVDADASTYVDVEQSADEDAVRMAVGGTLRYLLANASPHHTLTGDLTLPLGTAYIYAGAGGTPSVPNAQCGLLIGDALEDYNNKVGLGVFVGTSFGLSTNNIAGVNGKAYAQSDTTTTVCGLDFLAGHAAAGSGGKTLYGARLSVYVAGVSPSTATVNAKGISLSAMSGLSGTFTAINYTALDVAGTNNAKVTSWVGLALPVSFNAATSVRPLAINGPARTADTDGSYHRMNIQFGSVTPKFGGGDGVIGLTYATTNPASNPTGGVIIYADGGTGDFKVRGASGQICKLPTGGATNVTGSRGGNAALANLLTALAALGLVADGTTA